MTKNYYAPTQTFSVFYFYIFLGVFIFLIAINSKQSFSTFFLYLVMMGFLIDGIIRFTYHLKLQDEKIYECGFFTRKRVISVEKIKRIYGQKENFWSGGTGHAAALTKSNWQRQFYIESSEAILPKYPITEEIVRDLIKLRPDLKFEKGGVVFESPFKK